MSDAVARILLVESDQNRAEHISERLGNWYPNLTVDVAANEQEARQWRQRNHGIVCDYAGAMALIDAGMQAEREARDSMADFAELKCEVEALKQGQTEMKEKIQEIADIIDGDEVRPGMSSLVVALHGDHRDKAKNPGLIAMLSDIANNQNRMMLWGKGISTIIIGGLIGIALTQLFGK